MKTRIFLIISIVVFYSIKSFGESVVTFRIDSVYWESIGYDFDKVYSAENAYIGEIPMQTSVNEQGAAIINVPLELPDAGNGFKPDLAFFYNSMRPESMFGNEWGLSGLPEIYRVRKSIYYDDIRRDVDENKEIDGTEAFVLNGNRLIVTANNFPTSVSYQTETGNIRVKAHIIQRNDSLTKNETRYAFAYFELFYPNGKTAILGFEQLEDSKSLLHFPVSRISDGLENNIYYNYIFNKGEYRISQIRFGKNSEVKVNFRYDSTTVAFKKKVFLEEPKIVFNESIYQDIPPHEMATDCILKQVLITYNDQELRNYSFIYASDGKYIFLTEIHLTKSKTQGLLNNSETAGTTDDTPADSVIVLKNDTADFVMPLRFRYGENQSSNYFEKTVDTLLYYNSINLSKSKKAVFCSRQTDGIVVYPGMYFWQASTCSPTDNIVIKPNLNKPETFSLQAGTGFRDVLCIDLDGIAGDEIVRVNNYMSAGRDILEFSVYTFNTGGTLSFLYTKSYETAFPAYDDSMTNKEFFAGDFDGNGKNEILAVSSLGTYGQTYFAEIYDFENNTKLYSRQIFADIQIRSWLYTTPAMPEYDRAYLIQGDFNGDGKTEFFYRPIRNKYGALVEFSLEEGFLKLKKMGNDIDFGNNYGSNDYLTGDFNGDGRSDLYIKRDKSVYLSNGSELIETSLGINVEKIQVSTVEDMNGDGQSDLIITIPGGSIVYFISEGKIVAMVETPLQMSTTTKGNSLNYKTAQNELVSVGNNRIIRYSYGVDLSKALLITGVKSSLSTLTNFTYGKIDDETLYSGTKDVLFPFQNLTRNTVVVSKMSKRLNNEPVEVKKYSYENGIVHRQGVGFCGFEKVTVYDSVRNQSLVQTFDPLRFGVPISAETPTAKTLNTYDVNVLENKIARIQLQKQTATDKLRGNTVTIDITAYDSYDNPLTIVTDYGGGLKTTTVNTYSYTDNATTYRILPFSQTVTNTREGATSSARTAYSYNAKGLPTYKTQYVNNYFVAQEAYVYNSLNQLTELKTRQYSSAFLSTRYEYDAYGRQTKVTDPLGLYVRYAYNATNGRLDSITDHKGNKTSYTYDIFGKPLKQTNPDGTNSETSATWASDVEGAVYCVTAKATGQPTVKTWYDALGRELRSTQKRFDGSELITDRQYDARGRLSRESLPYKTSSVKWNTYSYDVYDRPLKITYASGKEDKWTYSGNSVTTVKDGISATQHYNARGELISVTNGSGTITYTLRPDGQPSAVNAGGVTTSFGYDIYARQTSITDPSAGLETMQYDIRGMLKSRTDANGKTISMTYDSYYRLTAKSYPEFSVSYTYTDGLLTKEQATNGTAAEYTYDNLGRAITVKETAPDGKWTQKDIGYTSGKITTINHSFSSGSKPVKEFYIYKNGYLYKNAVDKEPEAPPIAPGFPVIIGGLTTFGSGIALSSGGIQSIDWGEVIGEDPTRSYNNRTVLWLLKTENDMGLPTQSVTGPLTRDYAYNNYGYPTSRKATKGSTIVQDYAYNFNTRTGNLNYRDNNVHGTMEDFAYDNINRLTTIYNQNGAHTTAYDAKGNITAHSQVGAFGYNHPSKPYALTDADVYGNAIPLRVQQVTYTSFKRPATISENGDSAQFAYNSAGDRVKMQLQNDGATTLTRYYTGGNYEQDVTSAETTERLYLGGDAYSAPAVYIKDGSNWKIHYICRDYQGSITHLTDSAGRVVQELEYDAWGRLRDPQTMEIYEPGSEPDLLLGRGYTGHEHLKFCGLINMNARLYDPAVGRFLSPDPYVQDPMNSQNYNRYSYCLNNPLKYIDPTGEEWGTSRSSGPVTVYGYSSSWYSNSGFNTFVSNTYRGLSNEFPGSFPHLFVSALGTKNNPRRLGEVVCVGKAPSSGTISPVRLNAWQQFLAIMSYNIGPGIGSETIVGVANDFFRYATNVLPDGSINLDGSYAYPNEMRQSAINSWLMIGPGMTGVATKSSVAVKGVANATKVESLSTTSLTPTHYINKSKTQMQALLDDIRVYGINEPIKYVEHNGVNYIVNGHHRFYAAQRLGIQNVPVQQVQLPYGGYKSVMDLMMEQGKQPGFWMFIK